MKKERIIQALLWGFGFTLGFYSMMALLSPVHADYVLESTTDEDQITGYGFDSTFQYLAVPFTTIGAGTIDEVVVSLKKAGSPTDDTVLSIQTDDGGEPDGVTLEQGTYNNAVLTTSCADVTIILDAELNLDAATTYWLVFSRDGGNDMTNRPISCGDSVAGDNLAGDSTFTWSPVDKFTRYVITIASEFDGGGSGTTTDATSLEAQAQTNIFYGFVLFFIFMMFPIWLTRRK